MTDDQIIAAILGHEGTAYTNDPNDAGGPTKFGITLANLSAWRGHPCTAADVKALELPEADAIYRVQYLRPFDALTGVLRGNVIDMGVNAGVRRATMLLQEMVGADVDGWIGAQTVGLLLPGITWNPIYIGFRLAFYEDLILATPKNRKWRPGWRRRALSFLEPAAIPKATPSASRLMARASMEGASR